MFSVHFPNIGRLERCGFISVDSILFHWSMDVFFERQTYAVLIIVIYFKDRLCNASCFAFLLKVILALWRSSSVPQK